MKRPLVILAIATAACFALAQGQGPGGGNPKPTSPPKQDGGDKPKPKPVTPPPSSPPKPVTPPPSSPPKPVTPPPSSPPKPVTPPPSSPPKPVTPPPSSPPKPVTPPPSSPPKPVKPPPSSPPKPVTPPPSSPPKPVKPPQSGNRGGSSYSDKGAAYLERKPSQEEYFKRKNRTETGPIFAPKTGGANSNSNNNLRGLITQPSAPVSPPATGLRQAPGIGLGLDQGKMEQIQPFRFRVLWDSDHRHRDHYRRGYFHYDPYWRDCHFGYRFWVFDPWRFDCAYSPYYFYFSVPPYFLWERCSWNPWRTIIVIGGDLRWYYCGRGSSYYDNYYGYRSDTSRLDRALSDLVDTFTYADERALQRLVPQYGEVDILIDGIYAYSVNASDYYDMTADLIYSVYTNNFEILNVRRARSGEFWVSARHSFIDSWNRQQHVYMSFTLDYVDGRFVIVQAGTGASRYSPPGNY